MSRLSAAKYLDFYRAASLCMTGSLDLAEAMKATFDFLCQHFPLEGISLHQFDPVLKGHKLFFLVTRSGFHYVERFMPLNEEDVRLLQRFQHARLLNLPGAPMESLPLKHSRYLADLLPFKERAYLASQLWVGDNLIGHLIFLGDAPGCFTQEHVDKKTLLLPHFSTAMANMLQFQRALAFQQRLEEEVRRLRGHGLIGASGGLKRVMDMVSQLAGSETPVLISGETGVGKEIVADAIQRASPRKNAPFIKVNCGAIPETLVDSELFGYQKGAFTGAAGNRAGRFEQADGGTLFLDEVGELPLPVQVRLLRVLQNHVVERLGSNTSIPVDIRIIAATNRHLESMLRSGQFREDLYYRLNVFPIRIPPLRERPQDILPLVSFFIEKICARTKRKQMPGIRPQSLERLMIYTWPGNVRELENMVERAMILCNGPYIEADAFLPQDPAWYLPTEQNPDQGTLRGLLEEMVAAEVQKQLNKTIPLWNGHGDSGQDGAISLDQTMAKTIRNALAQCNGRVHGPKGAGALLGVNPNTHASACANWA